ncbi:MAG TPA: nucleotidyltransferase family protein [Methanospirillum sp.]|uniref:nucleotidyltransferase family protein n=1 Tax=Methanospirillum sp. TaxID=45200 RepID=UPI002C30E8F0|nr:nucleotidyltransferase family protein [Methanospirillum sp.]HWQ62981.1 nucleotidyltransferase family protein [Methanospirillum sp.]
MNQDLRVKIINTLVPYGVKKISVFGSYAAGHEHQGSDLDLIVSFPKEIGLFALGGIREELIEKLGISVDLLTERSIHPLLREKITQETVEIYHNEG